MNNCTTHIRRSRLAKFHFAMGEQNNLLKDDKSHGHHEQSNHTPATYLPITTAIRNSLNINDIFAVVLALASDSIRPATIHT